MTDHAHTHKHIYRYILVIGFNLSQIKSQCRDLIQWIFNYELEFLKIRIKYSAFIEE